jgi:pimeloyl-ACP methyl ester carboxylesterase
MNGPDHATGRAASGEIELFYRLFGKPGRTPVLILHGLSYFSYDWIEPAAALATDRQVAAMDMRGFGDSGWAKDYSVPAFAGDILALLDHLRWTKAILIGHSMGGRFCAWCAAEHPQRVAGLILVDWSPDTAPGGSKRVAQTVAATPENFAAVEDAMQYFGADPHSPQGASRRARFEAYLRPAAGGLAIKRDPHFRNQFRRQLETGERPKLGVDMWAALSKLACPTLVIRGTRTDMFARETVAKVKEANPRLALVEIDAGHNVAGENLEAFLREARAFLDASG